MKTKTLNDLFLFFELVKMEELSLHLWSFAPLRLIKSNTPLDIHRDLRDVENLLNAKAQSRKENLKAYFDRGKEIHFLFRVKKKFLDPKSSKPLCVLCVSVVKKITTTSIVLDRFKPK